MDKHHPPTWWFRLLSRLFPSRCREVPEATDPDRVLIRQFAIIKGRCYLQQFASGEHPHWYHSHPWAKGTIAIGLWGSVTDRRIGFEGVSFGLRWKRAPYLSIMAPTTIHQTLLPSPGHTSIFIGLGEKTDEKFYYHDMPLNITRRHWREHIQKLVKRL